MKWIVAIIGLLLTLGGAVAVQDGINIIQVERGWVGVIAGSVVMSAGLIIMSLALVVGRLELILDLLADPPRPNYLDEAFHPGEQQSEQHSSHGSPPLRSAFVSPGRDEPDVRNQDIPPPPREIAVEPLPLAHPAEGNEPEARSAYERFAPRDAARREFRFKFPPPAARLPKAEEFESPSPYWKGDAPGAAIDAPELDTTVASKEFGNTDDIGRVSPLEPQEAGVESVTDDVHSVAVAAPEISKSSLSFDETAPKAVFVEADQTANAVVLDEFRKREADEDGAVYEAINMPALRRGFEEHAEEPALPIEPKRLDDPVEPRPAKKAGLFPLRWNRSEAKSQLPSEKAEEARQDVRGLPESAQVATAAPESEVLTAGSESEQQAELSQHHAAGEPKDEPTPPRREAPPASFSKTEDSFEGSASDSQKQVREANPPNDWLERALSGVDEPPSPRGFVPRLGTTVVQPEAQAGERKSPKPVVPADASVIASPAIQAAPGHSAGAEFDEQAETYSQAQHESGAAQLPGPTVVGRYEAQGTSYVMYSDGSIDAETETGAFRFASLNELKKFIERRA